MRDIPEKPIGTKLPPETPPTWLSVHKLRMAGGVLCLAPNRVPSEFCKQSALAVVPVTDFWNPPVPNGPESQFQVSDWLPFIKSASFEILPSFHSVARMREKEMMTERLVWPTPRSRASSGAMSFPATRYTPAIAAPGGEKAGTNYASSLGTWLIIDLSIVGNSDHWVP